MKKIVALLLTLMLFASITGCASKEPTATEATATEATTTETTTTETTTTETTTTEVAAGPEGPYAGYDISTPVNLIMYVLGDAPVDLPKVLEKANAEYFQPILNSTLDVKFLSWADYKTKYPLILAGGEPVDLIYTSSWCFYNQEAGKGAFKELTKDWIKEWMPQTYESQTPASWDQMTISGKIFAVPQNNSGSGNHKFVGYRDDLAKKYNLPEVNSFDSYENYLFTIAENETSMQAYAARGNTQEIRFNYNQSLKLTELGNGHNFFWKFDNKADAPKPEDVFYYYSSDYYKDYALRMVTWADKGVWSDNAINNTTTAQDAFSQGTSATLAWNVSVFKFGKLLETNGVGTFKAADLSPDTMVRYMSYANDAFAITSNSENQERAALLLDLMKNNYDLYMLLYTGIEGEHYTLTDTEGVISKGPAFDNYGTDPWTWGIRNIKVPTYSDADPRQVAFSKSLDERLLATEVDGFTFNNESTLTEISVLNALVEEYKGSFDLGLFGADTEKTFEEFKEKMEQAGLSKIKAEFLNQYEAYCSEKGISY